MKLGERTKAVFGVMALWIVIYVVVFVTNWMLSWFVFSTETDPFLFQLFTVWIRLINGPLAVATITVGLLVGMYCLVHILRNKNASAPFRIVFFLGLWIMPMISIPAYYWLVVWKEPAADTRA